MARALKILHVRGGSKTTAVPWELAEDAASSLRNALGLGKGPIRNKALGDVLGTSVENLRGTSSHPGRPLPYGLRLIAEDGRHDTRCSTRSRWPHDRRFELVRALGDAIWADADRLGPLTASKTARQKFQRAFAQSLLCPYNDLLAYIDTEYPADTDISAAAPAFPCVGAGCQDGSGEQRQPRARIALHCFRPPRQFGLSHLEELVDTI